MHIVLANENNVITIATTSILLRLAQCLLFARTKSNACVLAFHLNYIQQDYAKCVYYYHFYDMTSLYLCTLAMVFGNNGNLAATF